jgi:hypothetical protein
MKNTFLSLLALVMLLASCAEPQIDNIFSENANQRVKTTLDGYKATLAGATNGWKGVYYPEGGNRGGYSFYLKFNANGNLSMYSDVAGANSDQAWETTYRLAASQKPTLIFDTYNFLHYLVDPDSNGGTGEFADLELNFVKVEANRIELEGIRNQTEMVLTPVTAAEFDAVTKGGLKSTLLNTATLLNSPNFLVVKYPNGQAVDLSIDLNAKLLSIVYINGQDLAQKTSAFVATPTGLELKTPITLNSVTISKLFWDNTQKKYYYTSGNTNIYLESNKRPALPFYYALGSLFSAFVMDPNIPSQSAEYKALYEETKKNVATLSTAAPARVVGDVYFQYFAEDGVFALVIDYTRTYTDRVDTFASVIYYVPTLDAQGNLKLTREPTTYTLSGGQLFTGASGIVLNGMVKLTNAIEQNTWKWDYDTVESRTAVLKSNGTPSISIKGLLF